MTEGMVQVWECKQGHRYEAILPITESICGKCDNDPTIKTTARMRLVEGAKATRAEASGKEPEMAKAKTAASRKGGGMKRPGSATRQKSVAASKSTAGKATSSAPSRPEPTQEALAEILAGLAPIEKKLRSGKATEAEVHQVYVDTRRANALIRRMGRAAA